MNTKQEERRTQADQRGAALQEDGVFAVTGGIVCLRTLPANCSYCGARGTTTVVVRRRKKRHFQQVHDHISHREGCEVGHERTT
jgi:hypothetical protein